MKTLKMRDKQGDRLLSIRDVAEKLGVSVRSVERQRDKLPAPVQVGGCVRWWLSEIETYMAALPRKSRRRQNENGKRR